MAGGAAGGEAPVWPEGAGRRVYAYLKQRPGLENVLSALKGQQDCRTLVYVEGLDGSVRRRFESANLRFQTRRVDLRRAADECDLAVLHAGQGATAAILLAGKQLLLLPLMLEQRLTADAVVRIGAGERAAPDNTASIRTKLEAMLGSDHYGEAARQFAAKYSDFDPAAQVSRMAGRVEELLCGEAGRSGGASQIVNASPQRPRRSVPAGVFLA